MDHPNVNIQEEMLLLRLKHEPDPIAELIKVVVQDNHPLIEFALMEHDEIVPSNNSSNMMSSKETIESYNLLQRPKKKIPRSYSQIKSIL